MSPASSSTSRTERSAPRREFDRDLAADDYRPHARWGLCLKRTTHSLQSLVALPNRAAVEVDHLFSLKKQRSALFRRSRFVSGQEFEVGVDVHVVIPSRPAVHRALKPDGQDLAGVD